MSLGKDKLLSIFLLFAFFVFGLYPLIPESFESFTVIILALSSLLMFVVFYKDNQMYLKRSFIISSAIFILFFLSAIYSSDTARAFKKLETMSSLIILPLIFYVFLSRVNLNKQKLKAIFLKIYFLSNFIYSLLSILVFYNYENKKYLNKDSNFFRNALIDVPLIGEHPIYVSIFLALAFLIGFTFYSRCNNKWYNYAFLAVGQISMFILIILLMSKSVICALFVSGIVWFVSRKKKAFYVIVCISSLVVALIFMLPKSNNRFSNFFKKETYSSVDMNNSTSIRFSILKCNLKLLKENPIIGYGVGDVQSLLDACYTKENFKFKKGEFNSHNQYFFVWLSCGLLGVFVFFGCLLYYFKNAIENKDYLMLSIITLYCIVFIFENILSRQSGVILFSFIMNLFVFSNKKLKNNSVTYL
ncbi:O-antigen ligase family protein [Tamlana sp. 62-3]|uniref:O-antigen ligase family protein n=1 Tax=Neotamlana sargassicola TaxID=2883125 RepID=A0A9X1I3P6_9FLAO|nr:O-antigen ligase family protein [Tamlana sargassicola]MCB4807311.1 O-antigen ligase family protein [Tamlana sargassicola]